MCVCSLWASLAAAANVIMLSLLCGLCVLLQAHERSPSPSLPWWDLHPEPSIFPGPAGKGRMVGVTSIGWAVSF